MIEHASFFTEDEKKAALDAREMMRRGIRPPRNENASVEMPEALLRSVLAKNKLIWEVRAEQRAKHDGWKSDLEKRAAGVERKARWTNMWAEVRAMAAELGVPRLSLEDALEVRREVRERRKRMFAAMD